MKGITRLILRLAVVLALIGWLSIALIRAQPYDAGPARALLLPPAGCSDLPCWQGMRPGVTTLDEAVRFFEQRPGTHYFIQTSSQTAVKLDVLYWRDADNRFSGSLHFADDTLAEMTLNGLQLYEVWLALGEPDGGQVITEIVYVDSQHFISLPTAHVGYYRANHFRLNILSSCDWFWQQRAYIILGPTIMPEKLNPEPTWPYQRRLACERWRTFRRAQREAMQ